MSTIYTPRKTLYRPNDPFFDEGNISLRSFWLQKEARSQEEIEVIKQEETRLAVGKLTREMNCDACHIKLPNISAYELHYEAMHKNVCIECRKVFPGTEWLQLHLDEFHNVILQLKKNQGEKIYRCFVTVCPKLFSLPYKRRLHLIHKHKYPEHFPFDLVRTGTLSIKERRAMELRKKRAGAKQANDGNKQSRPIGDTIMEELSANMAELKLPQSISFGRRSTAIYHPRPQKQQTQQQDVEMTSSRRPRKRGPKKKKQQDNMEV